VVVAFGVTNTPEPTFTPQFTFTPLPDQPTYTPYPTYTLPPTYTPLPTAAPAIVIPGATKIGLLPRAQDATQTQQAVFAEATQIVLNSQMTQTASSMQFQTTVATLQQTQPPQPGSGSTPVPPTGQFIPVYVTATPAGTPGVPGSHASGFFDGATCRYFVVGDDTLYSIALRLKIRVTTLAAANGIVNVELIRPGQYLKVPQPYCNQAQGIIPTQIIVVGGETPRPPGVIPTLGNGSKTYVVREGDTLFGIAARFRVSATALAQANNIANISLIYMGQILVIP
jgi:LysM repeat protein